MTNIFDRINNWAYNHVRKPISNLGGKIFTRISSFFTKKTTLDQHTQTITGDILLNQQYSRAYYIGAIKALNQCYDDEVSLEVLNVTRNSFINLLNKINTDKNLGVKMQSFFTNQVRTELDKIDTLYERSTTIKGKTPTTTTLKPMNPTGDNNSIVHELQQELLRLEKKNNVLTEYLTKVNIEYKVVLQENTDLKLNQGISSQKTTPNNNIAVIKALKEEITNLKNQLNDVTSKTSSRIKHLEAALSKLTLQKDSLMEDNVNLEAKIKQLNNNALVLEKQITALRKDNLDLGEIIKQSKEVTFVTDALNINKKNQELLVHNNALQNKITELTNALADYNADHLVLSNKELNQQLIEANARIKVLEHNVKKGENDLQKAITFHENSVRDFNDQIRKLSIELQTLTTSNDNLRFETSMHSTNWTNNKQVIALKILNTTVTQQTTIYEAIKSLQQDHFKISEQLTHLGKLFTARQQNGGYLTKLKEELHSLKIQYDKSLLKEQDFLKLDLELRNKADTYSLYTQSFADKEKELNLLIIEINRSLKNIQTKQMEAQYTAQTIRNASEDALYKITGVTFDTQEDFNDYIRRNTGYQDIFRMEQGASTPTRSHSASHITPSNSNISLNKIVSPNIRASLITSTLSSMSRAVPVNNLSGQITTSSSIEAPVSSTDVPTPPPRLEPLD